jgi:hypothetical protein
MGPRGPSPQAGERGRLSGERGARVYTAEGGFAAGVFHTQ